MKAFSLRGKDKWMCVCENCKAVMTTDAADVSCLCTQPALPEVPVLDGVQPLFCAWPRVSDFMKPETEGITEVIPEVEVPPLGVPMSTPTPQTHTDQILDFIRLNPGSSSTDLRTNLKKVPASTLSPIVAQLANKGRLKRLPAPEGMAQNVKWVYSIGDGTPAPAEKKPAALKPAGPRKVSTPKFPRESARTATKRPAAAKTAKPVEAKPAAPVAQRVEVMAADPFQQLIQMMATALVDRVVAQVNVELGKRMQGIAQQMLPPQQQLPDRRRNSDH